jgi:cardiolipin synthase A/B
VEEESFAHEMEEMYLQDLAKATEVVLDTRQRVVAPGEPRHSNPVLTSGGGGAGRAGAGAIRIGNVIGAALTNRRVLQPVESRIMLIAAVVLFIFAILFAIFPRLLAYPLVVLCLWVSLAFLYRSYKLRR